MHVFLETTILVNCSDIQGHLPSQTFQNLDMR